MPSRVRCLRLHQRHLFGCWICFGIENYPYGLLTMVVSLEAIFLSTFVLISQNRARRPTPGGSRSAVDHDSGGGSTDIDLLDLSRQISKLTKDVHFLTRSQTDHGDDRGRPSHSA